MTPLHEILMAVRKRFLLELYVRSIPKLTVFILFVVFFCFLSFFLLYMNLVFWYQFPRPNVNFFLPLLLVFLCLFLAWQRSAWLCWFRDTLLLLSASILIISVLFDMFVVSLVVSLLRMFLKSPFAEYSWYVLSVKVSNIYYCTKVP